MESKAKDNTKVFAGRSNSRIQRYFARTIVVFLSFVLLWFPVATLLSNFLVTNRSLSGTADAILVLASGADYRERSEEAARVFHLGLARSVLLSNDGGKSGWNSTLNRNPLVVERSKWLLIELGVPDAAIEILPRSPGGGTVWEAELMAEIAQNRSIGSILLVTSAYHSRRTLWTFEKVFAAKGVGCILGMSSASPGAHEPPAFDWWLHRRGIRLVGSEYVKMAYYLYRLPD